MAKVSMKPVEEGWAVSCSECGPKAADVRVRPVPESVYHDKANAERVRRDHLRKFHAPAEPATDDAKE